jgi:hypothetical protein
MSSTHRVAPRRPWLGFGFPRVPTARAATVDSGRVPLRRASISHARASTSTGRIRSPRIATVSTRHDPLARTAHPRPVCPSDRLIGLDRMIVTCDLKRLGGFYRFSDSSLDQNARARRHGGLGLRPIPPAPAGTGGLSPPTGEPLAATCRPGSPAAHSRGSATTRPPAPRGQREQDSRLDRLPEGSRPGGRFGLAIRSDAAARVRKFPIR